MYTDNIMTRFLLVGALIFSATPAYAGYDLSKLVQLEGVSLYSDEDESRVVIRFADDWKTKPAPVFYEKSVQIDIDGSYITPSKRNFKLNGPIVSSAGVYQISPRKVRIRLVPQITSSFSLGAILAHLLLAYV